MGKVDVTAVAFVCIIFAELAKYDGNLKAGLNVVEFFLGFALAFNLIAWLFRKAAERRIAKQ